MKSITGPTRSAWGMTQSPAWTGLGNRIFRQLFRKLSFDQIYCGLILEQIFDIGELVVYREDRNQQLTIYPYDYRPKEYQHNPS